MLLRWVLKVEEMHNPMVTSRPTSSVPCMLYCADNRALRKLPDLVTGVTLSPQSQLITRPWFVDAKKEVPKLPAVASPVKAHGSGQVKVDSLWGT